MTLDGSYHIPAPREQIFAALTDPAVLQRLIDGCESFTKRADGVYEARLRIGIGSIKGTYAGEARMEDVNPPESYTLIVNGRGAPGFVKGTADMHLKADAAETEVTCHADVQVGGLIAAVGSRLIEVVARRMMDKFFTGLAAEMAGGR